MITSSTYPSLIWKRAGVAFLAALLIFAVAGCGNKEENKDPGYYSGKDFGGKNATGAAASKKGGE